MASSPSSYAPPTPTFPPSSSPRTWLITAAASPIGLRLSRALLAHGDNVVLGALRSDLAFLAADRSYKEEGGEAGEGARAEQFGRFVGSEARDMGWVERLRVVTLDGRCESLLSFSSPRQWAKMTREWARRGMGKRRTHREGWRECAI